MEIYLSKNEYELFHNAIDKLLQNKANEITPNEAGATLTYWHESIHNLSNKSLLFAKFSGNQKQEMELATEFLAIKTLPDFYKQFNAEMPSKINLSSNYSIMTDNYKKAMLKLYKFGGNSESEVVLKIRQHIINGEWEDQKTGLIEALYGVKINGKTIDRRKPGILIDYAIDYGNSQFERKMNNLLGIKD